MSVINQMLKELEQRGVQVSTEDLRPIHRAKPGWMKPVVLVALLATLAALLWYQFPRVPMPTGIAAVPTPPIVVAERAVASAVVATSEVVAAPVSSVASPAIAVAASAVELAVATPVAPAAVRVEPVKAPVRKPQTAARALAEPIAPPAVPVKQISPAQQADAEFRKGLSLSQQGRNAEARTAFEAALSFDAGHDAARQSLVAQLLETRRSGEAEQVLQDGLKYNPSNTRFAILLARLQVGRNDLEQAIATLEGTLSYALHQADYQAFYAALLQRKGRHQESVDHYQIALKYAPGSGTWLMGYGISLQALLRNAEAKEAYQRALESKMLSAELQAFVQQKLKGL